MTENRFGRADSVVALGRLYDRQWETIAEPYRIQGSQAQIEFVQIGTVADIITPTGTWTAHRMFGIQNLDPPGGNKVTVVWEDSTANSNSQRVDPGRFLLIPDVDANTDLTVVANTAAVWCKVLAIGV